MPIRTNRSAFLPEPESNGSENGAFLFHSEPLFPVLPEAFGLVGVEPKRAPGRRFPTHKILIIERPEA
jgi:hypothetical protein